VPHYALSGGTLIALAADEIVMREYAVLGPVDPQLGQCPAASILKAVARKPVAEVDDQTLILIVLIERWPTRKLPVDSGSVEPSGFRPGQAHL
jgi:ClpP class serine protease